MQEVSDDEEPSPPNKKLKPVSKTRSTNDPIDGAEMISDDDTPSVSTNETSVNHVDSPSQSAVPVIEKRRSEITTTVNEERLKLMSDIELDNYIRDSFSSKMRIAEVEELDKELKRLTTRQRELEREGLGIIKEQIEIKQIYATLQVDRIVIQLKSEFPKKQADELENSGFL